MEPTSKDERSTQDRASLPVCTLPDALRALLEKADGHINAASKKLWYETERGFWSGDQAKARLAQVWLWLHGESLEPLPLVVLAALGLEFVAGIGKVDGLQGVHLSCLP